MSSASEVPTRSVTSSFLSWGIFWLILTIVGAVLFFWNGLEALVIAWQAPEYSHGPIIPILSAWLWLKHLKDVPERPGAKPDRWPGVVLVVFSLMFGALGVMSDIGDITAYGLILWIGGIVLISWGWRDGKQFWPPVVHLVYMLPLPATIYYKVTTSLQFTSSELGVYFLRLLDVPVFLDGNIIDLGVTKLHVAEACSGLRYMFPIMSFSYVFAVLYRGPTWHKAVLLISAVPIAIFMNSVRIAVAGIIVQQYGLDWLEGFTHFFEGWVIFIICIILLFALAWVMLKLNGEHKTLSDALDLDFDGIGGQVLRLRHVQPSTALISATVILFTAMASLMALPDRSSQNIERDSFALFPRTLGEWQQAGPRDVLDTRTASVLAADDYHQVTFSKPDASEDIGLFIAWYADQSKNGVHSPEVCLPGSGWEIAWIERTDVGPMIGADQGFNANRAIIQKGETRMMVYYWFQQKDRRIALDYAAKFWLLVDGVRTGRTDGALVRLTTLIGRNESDEAAEARLIELMRELQEPLPRFIPEG